MNNSASTGIIPAMYQNFSFLIIFIILSALGCIFFYKYRTEQGKLARLKRMSPFVLDINPQSPGCYNSNLHIAPLLKSSTLIMSIEINAEESKNLPLKQIFRNFLYQFSVSDYSGDIIFSRVFNGHYSDSGIVNDKRRIIDIEALPIITPGRYMIEMKIIAPLKSYSNCNFRLLLRNQPNLADSSAKISIYRTSAIVIFAATLITLLTYFLFTVKELLNSLINSENNLS